MGLAFRLIGLSSLSGGCHQIFLAKTEIYSAGANSDSVSSDDFSQDAPDT